MRPHDIAKLAVGSDIPRALDLERRVLAGETRKAAGAAYGICAARVAQILHKMAVWRKYGVIP